MTNIEFSNEFDVLYNSITSNQAPGLDEYEKSVFLTKAQDEIIKSYFNPRSNKTQEGFDGNEKRQIDFSMIMKSHVYSIFLESFFDLRDNTKAVQLETDILMFVNEYVEVTRGNNNTPNRLTVLPINYREYSRLMSKPYKRPLKNQAWRILDSSTGTKKAELIIGPKDTIKKYVIRYVKRPRAIILDVLSDGTSLDGYVGADQAGIPTAVVGRATQGITCELDPILHSEILQRAVELAKAAYIGDLQSQIALGQASQTNIGAIPASK